jgi:hypothetical protein
MELDEMSDIEGKTVREAASEFQSIDKSFVSGVADVLPADPVATALWTLTAFAVFPGHNANHKRAW